MILNIVLDDIISLTCLYIINRDFISSYCN